MLPSTRARKFDFFLWEVFALRIFRPSTDRRRWRRRETWRDCPDNTSVMGELTPLAHGCRDGRCDAVARQVCSSVSGLPIVTVPPKRGLRLWTPLLCVPGVGEVRCRGCQGVSKTISMWICNCPDASGVVRRDEWWWYYRWGVRSRCCMLYIFIKPPEVTVMILTTCRRRDPVACSHKLPRSTALLEDQWGWGKVQTFLNPFVWSLGGPRLWLFTHGYLPNRAC